RHQFRKRFERCGVEVLYAYPFVADHQRAVAGRVLGGDANRASTRMAALRLDATERKHESAGRIAPIRTERHGAGNIEGGNDLATGPQLDALPGIDTDQGVVNEAEAFAQRHAEMVDEFERRRAGTPLLAVDHDEIRINAGGKHRLADCKKFPRMPD